MAFLPYLYAGTQVVAGFPAVAGVPVVADFPAVARCWRPLLLQPSAAASHSFSAVCKSVVCAESF